MDERKPLVYGASALYNNSLVGASPYRVMVHPGAAAAARSFVAGTYTRPLLSSTSALSVG